MLFLKTIQMDREEQVGGWFEEVELLFQKQSIGAQRDELPAFNQTFNDLTDFLVDQWLAAGNGHNGCAALIDCIKAFLR